MPKLETRSTIACDREALFDFIIRPYDAQVLTPPKLNITILEAPQVLALGSVVRFQVEAYGLRQNFAHEVIEFEPGRLFVERQIEGIFRRYVHEHLVEEGGETAVELIERVEFEPPGGMAGFLLTEARIRENLLKSLSYSHAELKRQMELA